MHSAPPSVTPVTTAYASTLLDDPLPAAVSAGAPVVTSDVALWLTVLCVVSGSSCTSPERAGGDGGGGDGDGVGGGDGGGGDGLWVAW